MAIPALSPEQLIKPRHFESRIALTFWALFIPMGVHLPFFPLWLESQGFDAEKIAIILAAPMFVRVFTTPLITAFADRAKDRVNVLIATVVVALVVSLGYFVEPTFAGVIAVSVVLAVFWTPHSPLADSLALSGVRRFGSNYAHMRLWGSAAFLVANFAGGVIISATSANSVPVMISAGLVGTLIAALIAPRLGRPRRASPLSAAELQSAKRAHFSRYFLLCVAGAGLINASHGFMYGFASIYWKSIGLDGSVFGSLWASAVVAEVVMFAIYTRVFGHLSSPILLLLAGLACVVRWIAYPLVWPLGLGVGGFFAVQALHAVSTGLILLGVQKLIAEAVDEEHTGAAQGVAFFANGICMATVTLISGPIYQAWGVNGFYPMVAISVFGIGLLLLARRSAPQRRLGR